MGNIYTKVDQINRISDEDNRMNNGLKSTFIKLLLSFIFAFASSQLFAAFPATVDNTATIAVPSGVTDPVPTNNTSTDSNNLAIGSISGTVQTDTNSDGLGDAPLSGVTLTLLDNAGNPIDGDSVTPGVQPITVITNASGAYTFAAVPAGEYIVLETDPANYTSVIDIQSADGDTTANTNTNDNQIPVTVTGSENDAGNNFVDESVGTITETVFNDLNGNGVLDAGEGIPNIDVTWR